MRTLGNLRYFQSALELLTEREHLVRLLLESRKYHGQQEQAWLDGMLERPNFALDLGFKYKSDRWHRRGIRLRAGLEYLHFLAPEFADMPRYAVKALRREPPRSIRVLGGLPLLRTVRGRALLYRGLSAIERALPAPARAARHVEESDADLLVLGDVGSRFSLRSPFVRTAVRRGLPTAICVASWDNLSTRPRLRVVPHLMTVWNEAQVREAIVLHGIPGERVLATGAANFDQWFDWKPRPADEFLSKVGLDATRPVILWVGSAINGWERPESTYVTEWLAALRTAPERSLREVSVLLRPHPLRLKDWLGVDLSEHENVAMWPRAKMTMPVDSAQKADYYDSIFHSRAVVGINTSAMIEASIIGRPVLSVLEPDYHDSQFGSLHFPYLLEQGGGALRLARSMDEHLDQLGSLVAAPETEATVPSRQFIRSFVRPHGLERAATPILVARLEELAGQEFVPEPDPAWVAPLRWLIRAIMLVGADDGVLRSNRRRAKLATRLRTRSARAAKRFRRRLRRSRRKLQPVKRWLLSATTRPPET